MCMEREGLPSRGPEISSDVVPRWLDRPEALQCPYYRNSIALDHPVVNRGTALSAC